MLAALAAAVVAVPDVPNIPPLPAGAMESAGYMPNLYIQPAACKDQRYHVVDKYGRPVARRLADLPRPGGLQLLVDRRIDGCRVITVAPGSSPPAADQPKPPPSQHRIQPLPSE